jgi:phosphoribosylanthranilate isomerase
MAKIKICGLFRDEDIGFANEAGPDMIGFVFAPSRRQVSPALAARLRSRLREGIVPVGVFVNAPTAMVLSLYRDGVIEAVQLHGAEDSSYIAALRESCADGRRPPVIKAVAVQSREDISRWEGVEEPGAPDYLLLDSGPGGTGRRFDWTLIARSGEPGRVGKAAVPFFLAGGIDSDTISEALRYRPYGIDVSGGAETNSVKDRNKMIRLVRQAREEDAHE